MADKTVSPEEFQILMGYKHLRNVFHTAQKGKITITRPKGKRGGARVVMDPKTRTFLAQKGIALDDVEKILDKHLFLKEPRVVDSAHAREFLGVTWDEFRGVMKELREYRNSSGRQLWLAESVERHKANQNKGRR